MISMPRVIGYCRGCAPHSPRTRSLLMSMSDIRDLPDDISVPVPTDTRALPEYLRGDEICACSMVSSKGLRIEQEKIPIDLVTTRIRRTSITPDRAADTHPLPGGSTLSGAFRPLQGIPLEYRTTRTISPAGAVIADTLGKLQKFLRQNRNRPIFLSGNHSGVVSMGMVENIIAAPRDLSLAAEEVRAEVAASVRESWEHMRYATPRVQLAWGHHGDAGRIRHVNAVKNGLKCDCTCPACGETLVSRQGQVRAWHFAHSDGRECRNAVAAAVSRFLAQWLDDGNGLDLPELKYRYGTQLRQWPARLGMTFNRAEAIEDPDTKAWKVVADAGSGDNVSQLTILIRTNLRQPMPDAETCRELEQSTMIIDLGAVLAVALEINPDLCADEQWMTDQVVSAAPRDWIWNAATDRLYEAERARRLTPYLEAIENFAAPAQTDQGSTPARDVVIFLDCDKYIGTDFSEDRRDISGAFLFKRPAQHWRAEVFLELILRPIAQAFPEDVAYRDAVIGWKQSSAACRRLHLSRRSSCARSTRTTPLN